MLQAWEAAASLAAFFLLISRIKFGRIFSSLWVEKVLKAASSGEKTDSGRGAISKRLPI
jgi:hypothetical protein